MKRISVFVQYCATLTHERVCLRHTEKRNRVRQHAVTSRIPSRKGTIMEPLSCNKRLRSFCLSKIEIICLE